MYFFLNLLTLVLNIKTTVRGGDGGAKKFEINSRVNPKGGEGIVFVGGRGQLWRKLRFYFHENKPLELRFEKNISLSLTLTNT